MRRPRRALALSVVLLGALVAAATATAETRSRVICYTAYDSDYLYVAAVVLKPNLAATQTEPFKDPVKDDAVAIFLDAGPAGSATRSERSVEMAVSAAGGAQVYRGSRATPLASFQDFRATPDGVKRPFKAVVSRKGKLGETTGRRLDDSSYTVEMAIPWVEIGDPPKAGDRMRFNVVAFSAAPGSSPISSLSPAVKAPEDVQNPSLWGEIVFVDAPVRSVSSAPGARVSARVFSARPLIDGLISDGEWNKLTSFGFEDTSGTSVPVGPSVDASRIRPEVKLRRAPPAIVPAPAAPRQVPARQVEPLPKLVLALYQYDYQCDTRKSAPLASVRGADGASRIADHPLAGSGPWLTYDRVDWHLQQIPDIRRAGIDVILPIYRSNLAAKQSYAARGLVALAAALTQAGQVGADYPLVGLYLDTTSLVDAQGNKLDLRTPAGQALLYAAIREFFTAIPPQYRALIPLSPRNGGGAAIAVLSSAAAFAQVDPSLASTLRGRFLSDFGVDLLLLGGTDFKGKAELDGYVDATGGRGIQVEDSGRVHLASVDAGYDGTVQAGSEPQLRSRKDGDTYRQEWKQALSRKVDWVLIDGWNTYANGTEIAPSLEHGIVYADITKEGSMALRADGPRGAVFLWNSVPSATVPATQLQCSVRVLNAAGAPWTPTSHVLVCRWRRAAGESPAPLQKVPFTGIVLPGDAAAIPFSVATPTQPGDWELEVDVAALDKKGAPTAPFAGGSQPLLVPVRVGADAGTPYGAAVVASDLPTTVEAGGTYTARVTVRNGGSTLWSKAAGTRIGARLWRYTSPINGTGETVAEVPVEMADASAELPSDVAPGQQVTVTMPVTFSQPDGTPLPAASQADNWTYELRWECRDGAQAGAGATSEAQTVSVVDTHVGARFTRDLTPPQMPGERRIPVRLAVRNTGPQTWRKDAARIGYHWYYLDGTEAIWEDETTPITQDLEPGAETPEMLVWVTAPPYDGSYYVVWDVKVGDTWASTMPTSGAFETTVHRIDVVRGKLTFADIAPACNVDGVTSDSDRADGDMDGSGRSLPAELVPPFVGANAAPCTMWLPAKATGLDSPRHISFRWGPKGEKQKGLIQCMGQRVVVGEGRRQDDPARAVHILAAATKDGVTAGFTIAFSDGSQQYVSLPLSRWDGAPQHGEEVGFTCRYTHMRTGDAPGPAANLYHYVLPIGSRVPRQVVAVILPNAPEVRIAAITVER